MNNHFNIRQKGFTLIEAIIIAVIISILASIATPLYQGYITQQKIKMVNDIAESVAAAANGFVRQYNRDPTTKELNLYLVDKDRFSIFIGQDRKLLVKDNITEFQSDSISFK